MMMTGAGKLRVFGPLPLLSITVESVAGEGGDDIHLHSAGRVVWRRADNG